MVRALLFLVFLSTQAAAATLDCVIYKEDLPFEADDHLEFIVVNGEGERPTIIMYEEEISQSCENLTRTFIECYDEEGVPYWANILSSTEVTLTVGRGLVLPETKAFCESYE